MAFTSSVTFLERIAYSWGMETVTPTRLRLVAYGRVSTSGQLDGYGPEVQEKDMRRWSRTTGHKIVRTLFDGAVTGTAEADDRPELSVALALVADGEADGLLLPNLDRLARELTV